MNQMMMGEYLEKIVENGIYLPEKFLLNNKKIRMLILKEGAWVSIQLFDSTEDVQELIELHEGEHVEVISNKVVEIPNDGYFSLPEMFLEKVKNDREVIVCGMLNHVEIISLAEMEELEQSLKAMEEQMDDLWGF